VHGMGYSSANLTFDRLARGTCGFGQAENQFGESHVSVQGGTTKKKEKYAKKGRTQTPYLGRGVSTYASEPLQVRRGDQCRKEPKSPNRRDLRETLLEKKGTRYCERAWEGGFGEAG